MPSTGEELTGAWLHMIAKCDFVQYNVPLRGKQGEIDVIGLNVATKTAYICEVATHLLGLLYTRGSLPDNVNRLTKKFQSDADYARAYLPDFEHRFMLWSPVVQVPRTDDVIHNQIRDLNDICRNLMQTHSISIEMIVNETYLECLDDLQRLAGKETAASAFSVFRAMQIIEHTNKHVEKLRARGIDSRNLID